MKQLSKVVFMESARIRYQEFRLDGNIHFIGTQGVGKSTVLRAILFFYTADTRRLGISKEQKPFVEYYFPYTNSYIVYEVIRDNRSFSVWLLRKQNRVVFRFIEAPYHKEAFINSKEQGGAEIRDEAGVIKYYTSLGYKVEKQQANNEYRDIIYGANRSMRRYSMLQSLNYQNIPRTISNIFQHSSLDAGFIKQTIIHSLTDTPHKINLETNRRHLHTAKDSYADVLAFKSHERQAQNIVSLYVQIQEIQQNMNRTAWQVGAAYNHSLQALRRLESSIGEKQQAIEQAREARRQAEANAMKDINSLREKLGAIKKDIRYANERKRYYREQDIHTLLVENSRLGQYRSERRQKAQTLDNLTQAHANTRQKYEYALRDVDQRLAADQEGLRGQMGKAREGFYAKKDRLDEQYREYIAGLEQEYGQQLQDIDSRLQEVRLEINNSKNKLDHLQQKVWLSGEKERINKALHEKEREKAVMQEQFRNLQDEQQRTKERWQQETDRMEAYHEEELKRLAEQAEGLKKEEEALKGRLKGFKDTLLAFLEDEIPHWRNNIGRVLPESLLMRTDLKPGVAAGDHVYGLRLDLGPLEAATISKSELENRLSNTTGERKKLLQNQEQQYQKREEARKAIRKKYLGQVNKQAEKHKEYRLDLDKLAMELESLYNNSKEVEEQAERQREQEMRAVREALSELENQRRELQDKHSQTSTGLENRKGEAHKNQRRQIKELEQERDRQVAQANQQMEQLVAQAKADKQQLTDQRDKALKEKGADTGEIRQLEQRMQALDEKLRWLEDKREFIYNYNRDYEQYIAQLEPMKQEQKLLQEKMDNRQQNLQERLARFDKQLGDLAKALREWQDEQKRHQKQVEHMEKRFRLQELYQEVKNYVENQDTFTGSSVEELTGRLLEYSNQLVKVQNMLQERAGQFAGHFSLGNTLGFPEKVQSKKESMDFAAMLDDFIRHQKILDYEQEVNKKYAMVLEHIGKETDALLQHEDRVRKLIQQINRDFKNSNFVGVVHSIEMRTRDSEHQLMQILRAIQEFRQDHPYDFGTPNLFTTADNKENNNRAVELLEELYKRIDERGESHIRLEDAFELEFRIQENENDTQWVNRLANVGSNGTDVLVKSMIYINLLNVFKKDETSKGDDSKLHCLIDEVGVLHDSNVKGLIDFASARNIHLINGSPNSHNEEDYRHIYEFMKEPETHNTQIVRLLSHHGNNG